jgi:hypothetical protein
LYVFAAANKPKLVSIELLHTREDDGLGWHVDTHGEGFCSEQDFKEALLEKQFDNFLDDGYEPSMMDAYSPP